MLLGLFVSLLLVVAGGLGLLAARHGHQPRVESDAVGGDASGTGRTSVARLADLVHEGLGRTAQAVDVHVERRPVEEREQERPAPTEEHRTTLAVMGAGLLALGAVMAAGVVLLFA